jgi:hypothetical protein
MLSILTKFGVVRVSRSKATEIMGKTVPVMCMSCAKAIELEAATNGEPYTRYLFAGKSEVEDRFDFICSDGRVTLLYNKHTIARHSLLVRNFIEDYPSATEMRLDNHTSLSLTRIFHLIIGGIKCSLTDENLYTLQTLTPPTDLYYFFFDLPTTLKPDFVVSILRGITEEERSQILRARSLLATLDSDLIAPESDEVELPDQGRGLAIGYAIRNVARYLREVAVPEMVDKYPSYTFHEMVNYDLRETFETPEKPFLLTHNFDDDSGVLVRKGDRSFLIDEILEYIQSFNWAQCCVLLGMLGVKHPLLGNESVTRMAPYQLVLEKGSISYSQWCSMMKRFEEIAEVSMIELKRVMQPFYNTEE